MLRIKHSLTLGAALLLTASSLLAQTTGRIQGRVADTSGALLPGVTVTATSTNLQGNKVEITDSGGEFRFLSLPPGSYSLKAELDSFNSIDQADIQVGIDRTVTLDLTMTSSFAGEITVTGAAPVVDVSSSSTGLNVNSDTFEKVALARDFYQVAQLASGVVSQQDTVGVGASANPQNDAAALGPAINGSTGAENGYIIDGLNTTGIENGITAKTLNFEFIEEVEVKTGGLPAEYGRMSGGVINAITKSGGNEFEGDVFGYFAGGSLQADNTTAGDLPSDTTTLVDNDSDRDYGLDLGGYLLKDKLWFFAAYDRVDRTDVTTILQPLAAPGSPAVGSTIDADTKSDLYAGKLTYRISSNHNLSASIFGDPSTRTGPAFLVAGPASTWDGTIEKGSDDYVARYDGVFGGSWVIEGLLGKHQEEAFTGGAGKLIPQIIDQTVSPTAATGGFGAHNDQSFSRDAYKLDVSKFLGDHELKIGADREDLESSISNWNGGAGQRIYRLPSATGQTVIRHRYFIDDRAPGFNRNDPSTWVIKAPKISEPTTRNTSAYLQDSWRVLPNLTVNLGVRYERQELFDRDGLIQVDLDDEMAPRLGVVWDPANNGRSKFFANLGRFYESVPMDMNIRAFGGEVQALAYNFSEDPNNYQPDPRFNVTFLGRRNSTLGGTTPVDPDLEGQYIDEALLGYEYELRPNLAVSVQGTYRKLGNVIEDFLIISQGNYFIANPGQGLGSDVTFFDYTTAPAPKVERTYKGAELSVRKRYSDNWQMFGSYVWSKLEGNYDGVFQTSTGQLDPNINSAFDYADFLINADGYLSNDRRHQFKVLGSYTMPGGVLEGLTIGGTAWWRSGLPLNAYGYSSGYVNNEYFLVPRGSVGRAPSSYEADLHLSYPVQLGDRFDLNFLVDVFNVLDRQSSVLLDERYNRAFDGPCAGIPDPSTNCNGDGGIQHEGTGTFDPSVVINDPRATAPNPNYLDKAVGFTQSRSIRLGLRLSF